MSLTAMLFAMGCARMSWPEMPYLPLYSANNTESLLEDYHEARPLVVSFYNNDCGDCVAEDEVFAWNRLEQYDNIDVLGVIVDFDNNGVSEYVGQSDYYGMNYNTRIAFPNDYQNYLAALQNGYVPELPEVLIHIYDSKLRLGVDYSGTLLENEDEVYNSLNVENKE